MPQYDDNFGVREADAPKSKQETDNYACCATREPTIAEALDERIKLAMQNVERLTALRKNLCGSYLDKSASYFPHLY